MVWAAAILLPVVALIALGVAVLAERSGGGAPDRSLSAADVAASPVPEDRPAPAFRLPALQGTGKIDSAQFRGSVLVVNVWASWCGPCRDEAPQLDQAWNALRGRGVRFLGVDHQDVRADGVAFVREFEIGYLMAYDPEGTLAAAYGAAGVPTTFVIDAQGRIRYGFLGRVRASILERVVGGLLAP
jgi:cytochrome c biogenesis protein CcmG/thiol:disulfide interchange protein DsbE